MNDKHKQYFLIFLFFLIFQSCQRSPIAPTLEIMLEQQFGVLQDIQSKNIQFVLDDIDEQNKLVNEILFTAQKTYSLAFACLQFLDSAQNHPQNIDYQQVKEKILDYQQTLQTLILQFNGTRQSGIVPQTPAQMSAFLKTIFPIWKETNSQKIPLTLLKSQVLAANFRLLLFLDAKVNRSSWFLRHMRLTSPDEDTLSLPLGQTFRKEIVICQYGVQKNTACFIQNTPIPTAGFLPDCSRLGRDSVEIKAYFSTQKGKIDSLTQTLYYFIKP
jgi:hypothetical protein